VGRAVGGDLPDFFLVGAAKAGTTSLYHYLRQHPEIYMSPVKEPRYFALAGHALDFTGPGDGRLFATTKTALEDYRRLFADRGAEKVAGEASVLYLPHPDAAGAIASALPDARIVAVLRNPVERAYSGYLYRVRDGGEVGSFEEALAAEAERRAAGWYPGWFHRDHGFYFRHLSRYYERFPAEQIRVFLYEDFVRDPHELLRELFRFLGVEDAFRADVSVRWNPSGRPRSLNVQRVLTWHHPVKQALKRVVPENRVHRVIQRLQARNLERPPIRPETRAELVAGYADDIRQLEQLIGRDLSSWLS
jgi:sulfotransferase family protein